jgi:hypothetical protein
MEQVKKWLKVELLNRQWSETAGAPGGETEENNCLTSFCGRQPQDHQPFFTFNSGMMKQGCGLNMDSDPAFPKSFGSGS